MFYRQDFEVSLKFYQIFCALGVLPYMYFHPGKLAVAITWDRILLRVFWQIFTHIRVLLFAYQIYWIYINQESVSPYYLPCGVLLLAWMVTMQSADYICHNLHSSTIVILFNTVVKALKSDPSERRFILPFRRMALKYMAVLTIANSCFFGCLLPLAEKENPVLLFFYLTHLLPHQVALALSVTLDVSLLIIFACYVSNIVLVIYTFFEHVDVLLNRAEKDLQRVIFFKRARSRVFALRQVVKALRQIQLQLNMFNSGMSQVGLAMTIYCLLWSVLGISIAIHFYQDYPLVTVAFGIAAFAVFFFYILIIDKGFSMPLKIQVIKTRLLVVSWNQVLRYFSRYVNYNAEFRTQVQALTLKGAKMGDIDILNRLSIPSNLNFIANQTASILVAF